MNSRLRKAFIIPILVVCLMVFAVLFVTVSISNESNSAHAAVADLAFTVEAGIYDADTGVWTPYYDNTVSSEFISFRFTFTGVSPNPSITEFSYREGTNF